MAPPTGGAPKLANEHRWVLHRSRRLWYRLTCRVPLPGWVHSQAADNSTGSPFSCLVAAAAPCLTNQQHGCRLPAVHRKGGLTPYIAWS